MWVDVIALVGALNLYTISINLQPFTMRNFYIQKNQVQRVENCKDKKKRKKDQKLTPYNGQSYRKLTCLACVQLYG